MDLFGCSWRCWKKQQKLWYSKKIENHDRNFVRDAKLPLLIWKDSRLSRDKVVNPDGCWGELRSLCLVVKCARKPLLRNEKGQTDRRGKSLSLQIA